jgi:phosphohistidine phosphatase
LFEIVLNLDNAWQNVLIIGHNPGLTGLANHLAPCKLENLVSCGAVKLEFIVSNWKDIHPHSGFMHYYEYPKMISQL